MVGAIWLSSFLVISDFFTRCLRELSGESVERVYRLGKREPHSCRKPCDLVHVHFFLLCFLFVSSDKTLHFLMFGCHAFSSNSVFNWSNVTPAINHRAWSD